MSLGGYVLRRLLHLLPIALGVTILVFFLIHLVPGGPARTILGNQATDARVAAVRHDWGLGRPAPGAGPRESPGSATTGGSTARSPCSTGTSWSESPGATWAIRCSTACRRG